MGDSERPSLARRLLGSRLAFCALLAATLVATRLVCFDYETFFKLRFLPNHDMTAAMPFFVTNAHSARLTGDLAWWNPISYEGHGYPQYYQAFLSPMAPTAGHLTFVVWVQLVYLLNLAGVRFPEYFQFLGFTYVVLPFLTFLSFSYFASLLFRRRATVALVAVVYALSGIGVWNSAWFYFQEPFTLFFLLAAFLAVMRRPGWPSGAALLAAVLIQLASFNYWTIYNSWFVAIVLGTYALTHHPRVAAAWRALAGWAAARRRQALGVAALAGTVAGAWVLLLASVVREQGGNSVRDTGPVTGMVQTYTKEQALGRVQPTRWFTLELFNPKLDRATAFYKVINEVHCARYVGLVLLPLVLLFPFLRWGRRERWLAVAAGAVFCVCLAPPFLLSLWELQPGMNRIRHFFYFYTQHWQVMLVLVAGAVLDRLTRRREGALRFRMSVGAGGLLAAAALMLLVASCFSDRYPAGSPALEAITLSGALLLMTCGALLQLCRAAGPRGYAVYAWLLVGICFCDLSRYFVEGSRADHQFTRGWHLKRVPFPLPPEAAAAMRRPWASPDPSEGFAGRPANLPLRTSLWPDNRFMLPHAVQQVIASPARRVLSLARAPVRFYSRAEAPGGDGEVLGRAAEDPAGFFDSLYLHGPAEEPSESGPDPEARDLPAEFTRQGYNDFRLTVEAPADGWLLLRQLPDAGWRVRIDGERVPIRRANLTRMAVPVTAGAHTVEVSYRPRSRRLFWPACWLLEGGLVVLAVAAWRGRRAAGQGTIPAPPIVARAA